MLVLCVGMYRACSTWQYGVVGQILERHRDGQRLGFADGGGFASAVEPTLDESHWSVLKAHDAHPKFAERLGRGQALGIYSHRDLRDVAFSWMHKTGQTFDEIIERGFLEHCLENDRFWRDRPGMLFQNYEDLIAEPARGVAEIARHLRIELLEGEDREIADSLSLEANRERTRKITEQMEAEGVPLSPKDQDHYDRQSLLHWNHLRQGKVGDWRESATPEQKETLLRVCGPWLIEHGYEGDFAEYEATHSGPPVETRPRISYAQNMEDVLLDRLFRGRKGTYIDVGANHPTLINSTYYFYTRGWRGVNVEPVRSAFDLFGEKRPEDLNLQVAVSDVDGELPFYEVADCNGLSTLSGEMAEVQRLKGFQVIERVVPTWTMASLIAQHGLFPPDIFSIDVEGNEEHVLRGIPLATWQPKVFAIEATRPMTNDLCHQDWEPILLDQGYLFAFFDGINRFYLRRGDLAHWLPLLDCPVNALDFYVKAETVEQHERADWLDGRLAEEHHRHHQTYEWMMEAKLELADLKVRFGNELDDRHRDYLAWCQERQALEHERDETKVELADLKARFGDELDARHRDYLAWSEERKGWEAERHSAQAERTELVIRVDDLGAERDQLVREAEAMHRELARLHEAIHARDLEIDRTRTQLGPYLKLDRLGVVSALQRKVHAHRAHAKD